MPLLSEKDRQTVRGHLAVIDEPVRLLFFTQTIGAPETAHIARQVLDEIASLNDLVTLEEVNFVLDQESARRVRHRADSGDRPADRRRRTRASAFSVRRPATSSCR